MIALPMSSGGSVVLTIVTKEQRTTGGFWKDGSHHSLVNSCHMATDNLLQVILICDVPKVCFHADLQQNVQIPLTQHIFLSHFFSPCAYCFKLLCILYSFVSNMNSLEKKVFHLTHFFQKIFHIMYLYFMGANNSHIYCSEAMPELHFSLLFIPPLKKNVKDPHLTPPIEFFASVFYLACLIHSNVSNSKWRCNYCP